MTVSDDELWAEGYKIPWDDPDFSRRMLAEHLSQEHDLASRRTEWIDKQVEWIHTRIVGGKPARILDLGCGPGLYAHRLAGLGHHCRGIDFGPASIEHAREHNPDHSRCEFVHGDMRHADFAGPHDLGMILYGEFNVFPPHNATAILRKVHASLVPRGKLIIEPQTLEVVEATGRAEPSEQQLESGLFSDRPHVWRTDNRWLPDHKVAVQTFTITDRDTGARQVYRSTTRAWSDGELREALASAGFSDVSRCADWPCDTDSLVLWIADR
ncbi:MAG: class I SAM-dependent methyltransferase [Phycisphaerales bacterium]|nr:MAG: class I SAM-dependent methyltransferase [Phycisphaerales bacterium]